MSEFLSLERWLQEVVHPSDGVCRNVDFYNYCKQKHDIALRFNPSLIAEIGVRLGYSAYAFLTACPQAIYHGYDVWGGGSGGTKIAGADYVAPMLARNCKEASIELHTADTQRLNSIELRDVDFFHIDGDHTYYGALHDLEIVWPVIRSGGVMVVDDYDFLIEVRGAVDQFIRSHTESIQSHEYFKTFRGDMTIVKK